MSEPVGTEQPKTAVKIIATFLDSSVEFPPEEKVTRRLEDKRSGYLQGYNAAKGYIRHMLKEAGIDA
jgi:hypothetical protein